MFHNIKRLKARRKDLRQSLTPAEATLWKCLQNSQLDRKKFRRQHSVGSFIIDFYCAECRLAIELDGEGHYSPERWVYEQKRTEFLEKKSIRILRFENREVFDNLEFVLAEIQRNLVTTPPRAARSARLLK